jgi:mannose-6-phosphate isomerase class I
VQVHPDDETVEAAASGRLDVDQDLQANPTVRLYDFGRRPGEYPELGFRLVDPAAGLRRVEPARVELRSGHSVEVMVADEHFAKHRIDLTENAGAGFEPLYGSYRVLHCLEGEAEVTAGDERMLLGRGETMFIPACWERQATIAAEVGCVLFDDAFPNVQALSAWLAGNGVPNKRIQGLLTPRRAL